MWNVVFQTRKKKTFSGNLNGLRWHCAEHFLKHVEIHVCNKHKHEGKVFGISARSWDWDVIKPGACYGLDRIEEGKGLMGLRVFNIF